MLVCIQPVTNFFQTYIMVETAKLYILLPVWMTVTIIWGHRSVRNHKLLFPLSLKFHDLDKIQPVDLLKLILVLFLMIVIQGRKFYLCDFRNHTLNIGMCLHTSHPICYKPGMVVDVTKLFSMIPV